MVLCTKCLKLHSKGHSVLITNTIQHDIYNFLPSNRALLLQTPPPKCHFISATREMITPTTAIIIVAILW